MIDNWSLRDDLAPKLQSCSIRGLLKVSEEPEFMKFSKKLLKLIGIADRDRIISTIRFGASWNLLRLASKRTLNQYSKALWNDPFAQINYSQKCYARDTYQRPTRHQAVLHTTGNDWSHSFASQHASLNNNNFTTSVSRRTLKGCCRHGQP